jgi:hypothetical protein
VGGLEQRVLTITSENEALVGELDAARRAASGAERAALDNLAALPGKPREAWPRVVQLVVEEAERRLAEELRAKAAEDAEMLEGALGGEVEAAQRALASEERKRAALEAKLKEVEGRAADAESAATAAEVKWRRQLAEAAEAAAKAASEAEARAAALEAQLAGQSEGAAEEAATWRARAAELQVRTREGGYDGQGVHSCQGKTTQLSSVLVVQRQWVGLELCRCMPHRVLLT